MDARCELGSAHPIREARVVLDPGARAGLSARCDRFDDERRVAFGCAVERGGQPGGARPHDDDVVALPRRSGRKSDPFSQRLLEHRSFGVRPLILGRDGRRRSRRRGPNVAGAHEPFWPFEHRTIGEERQRVPAICEPRPVSQQVHERVVFDIDPLKRHAISAEELSCLSGAGRRGPAQEICRRVPHSRPSALLSRSGTHYREREPRERPTG